MLPALNPYIQDRCLVAASRKTSDPFLQCVISQDKGGKLRKEVKRLWEQVEQREGVSEEYAICAIATKISLDVMRAQLRRREGRPN